MKNNLNIDNSPTNSTDDDASTVNENVVRQFKIILVVVMIMLLLFLGFFVYNLIKCYLPKWRSRSQIREEDAVAIENQKIEIEEF